MPRRGGGRLPIFGDDAEPSRVGGLLRDAGIAADEIEPTPSSDLRRRLGSAPPMSDPKPKGKRLAEFAETDAILRLLSGVQKPKAGKKKQQADEELNPPPLPDPALTPPVEAFVGDDAGRPAELDSPPIAEVEIETESEAGEIDRIVCPLTHRFRIGVSRTRTVQERRKTQWGERNRRNGSIGFRAPYSVLSPSCRTGSAPDWALPFGDLLARINWKNRPEDVQQLPLIGEPDPPGYAESVEGVLAAFKWDDE